MERDLFFQVCHCIISFIYLIWDTYIYSYIYMYWYIHIQFLFFSWLDFFIVLCVHFRNNNSDGIILGLALLNSNAVQQFEGWYFSPVTNILKDLEWGKKNTVKKPHCLRLFLSVWIPVAIWNVLALLLLVLFWRAWQKARQCNKEFRISLVKTPAKRGTLESLVYIYWEMCGSL